MQLNKIILKKSLYLVVRRRMKRQKGARKEVYGEASGESIKG